MSTRCQILFKFSDGKVLTYRHSDGYPTGVLPDLVEFLKWNKGRNSDPEYTLATYFYFMKKGFEQYTDNVWNKDKFPEVKYADDYRHEKFANDHNLQTKLGFGLCFDNKLHFDIEYFYVVEFIKNKNAGDSFGRNESEKFVLRTYIPEYLHEPEFKPKFNKANDLVKNSVSKNDLVIEDLDKISVEQVRVIAQEIEDAINKGEEE